MDNLTPAERERLESWALLSQIARHRGAGSALPGDFPPEVEADYQLEPPPPQLWASTVSRTGLATRDQRRSARSSFFIPAPSISTYARPNAADAYARLAPMQ